jgi:AcrR family transcriptional regulator
MTDEARAGDPGRSIWVCPARSGRGPVPEHSTQEIARAAIELADGEGLAAVTMRAVAAAVGTAPASLYRYLNTRSELLELMADQVVGEHVPRGSDADGDPTAGLLALARQMLAVYREHPWLLEIPPTLGLPGPNALAYLDRVLAILSRTDLSGPAKLELVGLFSGAIRAFAQMEADQQRAGQDTAAWQASVASYLIAVVTTGQYPHLAAVLSSPPTAADLPPDEPLFDRAMTRILSGLLPPVRQRSSGR